MRKDQQHNLHEEESTIFSQHKSAAQIAQEKKDEKEAQKARRRAIKEKQKEEKKNRPKTKMTRSELWITIVSVALLATVMLGGIALIIIDQVATENKQMADSSAYFYSTEQPELSTEGIKGTITEAYYTNDGCLAVHINFSNGLNADHYLTELEVSIQNSEGEKIASGYTQNIPNNYCVPPNGYNTFTFYIEKEHVLIANDDLDTITYEISTTGEVDTAK